MEEQWTTNPWIPVSENIVYLLISVIGIVANAVVIVVISVWEKSRANRSVPQILVVHLAVADLLLLITLPLSMPAIQGEERWWYGSFMCKLVRGMEHLSYHASITFLTVMSLDRLLATVYLIETRVYRTRKNAIRVTALVWLLSLVVAIPPMVFAQTREADNSTQCLVLFPDAEVPLDSDELDDVLNQLFGSTGVGNILDGNTTVDYYGEGGYDDYLDTLTPTDTDTDNFHLLGTNDTDQDHRCLEVTHRNSVYYKAYELFNFVVFYLAPVILIVLSYSAILHTASRRVKRIRQNQASSNQAVVVVAVLVTAFLVSWSPYLIWRILMLPPGIKIAKPWHCDIVNVTLIYLAYSNSAINPILYSLSSRNFRKKMIASYNFVTRGGNRRTLARHKTHCSQPKTSGGDDPNKKYESRSVSTMLCHSTKSNSRVEGYSHHAIEDEYNHISTRGSRLNSKQQSDQNVNRSYLSKNFSSAAQPKSIGNTSFI